MLAKEKTIGVALVALATVSLMACDKSDEDQRQFEQAAKLRALARQRIEAAKKNEAPSKGKKSVTPPTPRKRLPLPKVDLASLKADVKAEMEAIEKLPATARQEIVQRMMRLAFRGPEARDALGAIASKASLPEPQRALAGIWYCRFYRYDVNALLALLDHPNPFVQRATAEQLKNHGGPEAIAALMEKANTGVSRGFRQKLETYARTARKKALPPRANAMLHRLLDKTDRKTRKMASVVLTADYFAQAEADMLELLSLRVADKDARMWLASAITKGAEKNVVKLKTYTKRGLDKYLRYNAVLALAKLGAPGKAVLKELLAAPKEPLAPHIAKLVR